MGRIIIFTGKGGVGKSSVAAAHAIKSAMEGKRTLLVSTDMAHNLGDIFEKRLGKEPEEVLENLDAYEIDPDHVMAKDYASIMEYVTSLVADGGIVDAQDVGMIPGTEELFSLLKIAEIYKSDVYERIIVDCAPTGETLSLLKFPELLSWYMEKLFPIGKVGIRMLSPVSKTLFKVEMPNKTAVSEVEKLYVKLMELQELLKDREITSVRIVTTPEKMVIEETKRNYMYLNLYNFNVDGLYINRILPQNVNNPFFDRWLMIQREYVDYLRQNFAALPVYEIPWYDEELKGVANVCRIVRDVLDEKNVFETRILTERETFAQTENGYELKVFLPNAEKEKIDLYQAATDIVIKTGNFKRNIPLPNILRQYVVTGAKFEGNYLRVQFEKEADGEES
ncbi:MAG: ArsA family ATPase [Lachnospiraceae bacterium]|nr:ArsA family ATPase [Lachnospiraceae bacterium]